jgi:cell wall-associated NlpC family hydrolase
MPTLIPPYFRLACLLLFTAALSILAGCAGSPPRTSGAYSRYPHNPIAIDGSQRNEVVLTAMALLDTPYQYGGATPRAGFDCSGLIDYVFSQATATPLPHNTAQIAQLSRPIPTDRLMPGDFVFFNTLHRPFSHMGIYIGDGRFINAPSSGGQVRINSLHSAYFAKRFETARTLFRD